MTQSEQGKDQTGLDNTTYNLISALEKEADFLYTTVGTYMEDARKENRPEAEEVWKAIKETKRKNVQMLRDALANEVKQNRMTS
ncbi:MAG: hypothetical protein ABI347_03205 [Nitrososphaera sp.]|jgi:rubrerythrin